MAKPKARKSKGAAPAKRKLSRAEIDRRLELARRSAEKERVNRRGIQPRLFRALELAQSIADDAGYPSVLKLVRPPLVHDSLWKQPWTAVGRFIWRTRTVRYADLYAILTRWTLRKLEDRIHAHRWSRIRIAYVTERGKREEYTLSETGPWAMMLARAREECDPSIDEGGPTGGGSLASRYPTSAIESVFVWLSETVATHTDVRHGKFS